MPKEYDTFVNNLEDVREGEEISLSIRDLTPGKHKYRWLYVKAIISSSAEKLLDSSTLWIRYKNTGLRHLAPFAIKIIEIIEVDKRV